MELYRKSFTQNRSYAPLNQTENARLETIIYDTQLGALDIKTLAHTIDREIAELHPKFIEKHTIGPFYNSFTNNSDEIQIILPTPDSSVLKFTRERVLSIDVRQYGNILDRLRGKKTEQEIFGPIDYESRVIVPFRVKQKNLEYHFPKVNDHLKSINRGDPMQRDNLFTLVKGIGSANEELIANKVQSSLEDIIKGFALYYEMNALVENRMKAINSQVEEMEKLAFVNTYSMFSAAAYIQHQLGLLMENKEPIQIDANFNFRFDYTKDDVLAYTLAKYFGLINIGKRDEVIKEEVDFPAASYTFFKTLKQNALEKKTGFNPKLVDLIKDSQFKIMDEFTISGFEATHEEKAKAKVEFAPIMPHQVAGNVLAKKEM